jgi:tetratricopeptide (TPR) repeat protein
VPAAERLEAARRDAPDAVVLARMLSLSMRAEPALVRGARLEAGLPASAESDLWFSSLVVSAGPLGIALDPGVADLLRDELARDPDALDAAWRLLERHHAGAAWSVRLEERINHLTAGGATSAAVQDLLAAALVELRRVQEANERGALGIARWLVAAVARLPAVVAGSPAATLAGVTAGAHLDGRIGPLDALDAEHREQWLPWLLASLGTTVLPVRLTETTLILGGVPAGAVPLEVPRTEPVVVTVVTQDGASHEVTLRDGDVVDVPIDRPPVTLRTVSGTEVELGVLAVGRLRSGDRWLGAACAVEPRLVVTADSVLEQATPDDPVIFVPALGGSVAVDVATPLRADGLTYLRLAEPASTVVPLGRPTVGAAWRAEPDASGTVSTLADGVMVLECDTVPPPGAAVTLEDPWGVVIGMVTGPDLPRRPVTAAVIDPARATTAAPPGETPAAEPTFDPAHFALLGPGGRLQVLREVSPEAMGVAMGGAAGYSYVSRDIDDRLQEAIARAGEGVVVAGERGAGKTRTLYEAAWRTLDRALLARPRPGSLRTVMDQLARTSLPEDVVVWLDDLADFAGELPEWSGTGPRLDRRRVILLATADDEPSPTQATATSSAYARDFTVFQLTASLSPQELARARERHPALLLDADRPWDATELETRERGLERLRAETGTPPEVVAEALDNLADQYFRVDRRDEARRLWREELALRREIAGDGDVRAQVDLATALLRWARGFGSEDIDPRAAEEALELLQRVDEIDPVLYRGRFAQATMETAEILVQAGRVQDGVRRGREAIDLTRREAVQEWDQPGTAVERLGMMLRRFASLLVEAGEPDGGTDASAESIDAYRRAVAAGRADATRGLVFALEEHAELFVSAGRLEDAIDAAREAVSEARPTGEARLLGGALSILARQLERAGRADDALSAMREQIAVLRDGPAPDADLADALTAFANLLVGAGRVRDAFAAAEEAVGLGRGVVADDGRYRDWLVRILEVAADAADRSRDLDLAIAYNEEQIELLEDAPDDVRGLVEDTLAQRRARRARAGEESKLGGPPVLGTWPASHLMGGVAAIGGTLVLLEHLLLFVPGDVGKALDDLVRGRTDDFAAGDAGLTRDPRIISLDRIEWIEARERATLLRPPSARIHLVGGGRFDVGVLTTRGSRNARPENHAAFRDWLGQMPAWIPRRRPDAS